MYYGVSLTMPRGLLGEPSTALAKEPKAELATSDKTSEYSSERRHKGFACRLIKTNYFTYNNSFTPYINLVYFN